MANLDTTKLMEVNLQSLTDAVAQVAASKDASKEVRAQRVNLKAALKLDISDAFKEELETQLAEAELALGLDTTAGDNASLQLQLLASIDGALTEKQKERVVAALDAWKVAKPGTRSRGSERVTSDKSYAPGVIGFFQGDAVVPYAVERPTWGSMGHTLHKGGRVALGASDSDKSVKVTLEGFDALREGLGSRENPGPRFEVGAVFHLATNAGPFRVEVLDTSESGPKPRGAGLKSITRVEVDA